MQTIFDIIGMIALTGGIAGAVATALLKIFGERWIGSKFDKEIERLRDSHARELAHLTYQIDGLLDRTTKLNDWEFRIVPEAWGKTLKAYNLAVHHTSSGRMVMPVSPMDDETLEDFLAMSPLLDSQKNQVRRAEPKDRTRIYYDIEYFHNKDRAEQAAREMSIFLQDNAIFIRNEERFAELETIVWAALNQHRLVKQFPDMRRDTGTPDIDAIEIRGKAVLQEIKTELRDNLWSNTLAARGVDPKAVETR